MEKDRGKQRSRSKSPTPPSQPASEALTWQVSAPLAGPPRQVNLPASGAPPSDPCDMLTVEQFADRMQISRATVFNLMGEEVLLPGIHFIRLGRTIRFPWSPQLIANLLQASAAKPPRPPATAKPAAKPAPVRRKPSNPINWEY